MAEKGQNTMNQEEREEIRKTVYGMIGDGCSPFDILDMISQMTDEDITACL